MRAPFLRRLPRTFERRRAEPHLNHPTDTDFFSQVDLASAGERPHAFAIEDGGIVPGASDLAAMLTALFPIIAGSGIMAWPPAVTQDSDATS
jgi:hypothetical protein